VPSRREMLEAAIAGALLPLSIESSASRAEDALAPLLGALRAVTLTAANLKAVEDAWTRFMGYRVVDRGTLTRSTVESWQAPALRDKPYLILGPESGEPTYLRFIEQATAAPEAHTLGWTTTEITVQNSDDLYERLKDSPFTVRGPPRQIPTYSYLKAMQATGPAGEKLNLTWITEPRPDLAVAKSFVGRVFIAVLAAPDLPAALDFYRATFGNVPSPIRQLPNLQLAVVPLADGTKLEVDHAGAETPLRKRPPGGLPAGLAMVTFECKQFERFDGSLIAKPVQSTLEPRHGGKSGVLQGPAGELIELVET
jgi:catechol 2,3-dioxygenase-like lactoylglutathione lyase family enzyme